MTVYLLIILTVAVLLTLSTFLFFIVFLPSYLIAAFLNYYYLEKISSNFHENISFKTFLLAFVVGAVAFTIGACIEIIFGIAPSGVSTISLIKTGLFIFISSSIIFCIINGMFMFYIKRKSGRR